MYVVVYTRSNIIDKEKTGILVCLNRVSLFLGTDVEGLYSESNSPISNRPDHALDA